MDNVKLYWEFHKSTLIINWTFSFAFSMILISPLLIPIVSMTGGPLISIFYKEISRKNEYYFYYNRGISKLNLIIISLILNILIGLVILFIVSKCQTFLK